MLLCVNSSQYYSLYSSSTFSPICPHPSLLTTILLVSVSMGQFLFCLGCSFFNFFIFFLFCFLFLFLFNYSCPHCPPLLSSALPTPISHIQSSHPPLSLLMGLLYMFLDLTLPLLSPITLLSPPL